MRINRIIYCLLCCLFFVSCGGEHTPKPLGYPRVDRGNQELEEFDGKYFTFMYPSTVMIGGVEEKSPKKELWFNLSYPDYDATVHCTYIPMKRNDLRTLLDDSYHLAYGHAEMANGISASVYADESHHVFSTIYDIKGNVATPIQFYATDSLSDFLRGSLYFNKHIANRDSIAPYIELIREDIVMLIETLQWKK